MSRLLPDIRTQWPPSRLYVSLLQHGEAVLRQWGFNRRHWDCAWAQKLRVTTDVTAALSQLLDASTEAIPAMTKVHLLLPDNMAVFRLIAWQPALQTNDEQRQYAIEHFERAGLRVRAGWVVESSWCGPGNTLAYALPQVFVQSLETVLQARGLILSKISLPSVLCHYGSFWLAPTSAWRLLNSGGSLTLMVYQDRCLTHWLNEPGLGSFAVTLQRLLGRYVSLRSADTPSPGKIDLLGLDPVMVQPWLTEAVRFRRLQPFSLKGL